MDEDVIAKYRVSWWGKGEDIGPTFAEMEALKRELQKFPLNIVPVSEGIIEYYPEGGMGSASIPHLLRFDCPDGIERMVRTDKKDQTKKIEFVHFCKCLCLKFDKYTIEILSEKPSGRNTCLATKASEWTPEDDHQY